MSPRFLAMPYRMTSLGLVALLAACQADDSVVRREERWPVGLVRVERMPFQPQVLLLGVIQPTKAVIVRVPADGVIHYPAHFGGRLPMGAEVTVGEVLATVTNSGFDLGLTEAQLAVDTATADRQRTERAFGYGLVPRMDLDRAKVQESLAQARLLHAEQQSAHLAVQAPIAGRLMVPVPVPDGSQASRDSELAEIVGRGALQVAARAAPDELAGMHSGLTARLRTADGEDEGGATVSAISPLLDQAGTASLLARVETMSRGALAGEGVQLIVALDPRQAITVPEQALVMGASGEAVYVLDSAVNPMRVHLRPVQLGGRAGGRVEVLQGLRPGERVVAGGTAPLSDGAAVVEEAAPGEVARGRSAPQHGAKP